MVTGTCPECGRVFDLFEDTDAAEFAYGHDCEVVVGPIGEEVLPGRLMQDLIDSGAAWRLEGSIGREAMRMIELGECVLGKVGHRDHYGNYVPSRYEVLAGTKGSVEYAAQMQEEG